MTDYTVIMDKSTEPVGTVGKVKAAAAAKLAQRGVASPFSVVSNPEVLKEGAAVEDFMRPDRMIVMDVKSAELLNAQPTPWLHRASAL